MINWKVRVRQKWFWLTLIPAVLLLLDQLWGLWVVLGSIQAGHLYDGPVMEALLSLAGTAFAVLVLLGIPVDTTTQGYGDSPRALLYDAPAPNASAYGLREFEEQCAAADAKMVDWAAPAEDGASEEAR
ncbi:phage holin [Adlercreutzia mucosicola]|uniref:phage holin n=1 Tax=Adlercreutzia mucosicola TaxID=580026 RepID=UPI0003FE590C|nr:phage holin [Adlercreutzia mucosicola]MCR2036348.1 phage holin [Adlercreutzia mucosicola]